MIDKISTIEPDTCIVVKSTIPVGFIDGVREKFDIDNVIFSPEFLREGRALFDNYGPASYSGGNIERQLSLPIVEAAKKPEMKQFLQGLERRAIKLYKPYLAMRVAFFNELDSLR